ncbi:hypothetical protein FV225_28950, partial [Methylobacterium sp. WL93]
GGPRVSEGRERGARYPAPSLPSPDPLRGPPSPAEGGGKGRSAFRKTMLTARPPHRNAPPGRSGGGRHRR